MEYQIDVKQLNLQEDMYAAIMARFKNEGLAKAISQNFHNSGLTLLAEGIVKASVTETLDVYAEEGKIKGVVVGLDDTVRLAYADNTIFKIYVPTDKPNGVALVTIKYN